MDAGPGVGMPRSRMDLAQKMGADMKQGGKSEIRTPNSEESTCRSMVGTQIPLEQFKQNCKYEEGSHPAQRDKNSGNSLVPEFVLQLYGYGFIKSTLAALVGSRRRFRASVFGFLSDFGFRILILVTILFLSFFPLGARAQDHHDPLATFFLGRIKYSQNDGNDCGGVGQDLMKLVSRASTLKVQQEKKVRLTDPELFETPFVFMNGHNDFVLTEVEIEVLRKYLEHGGFFFASGCCTNPNFPKAWRREFSRLFPAEPVKPLPYDHLIYRSFYNIPRLRSMHENREILLEGVIRKGNLVAV